MFASTCLNLSRTVTRCNSRNFATTGVVKWFNTEKGYGFITPNDGGADVFAHHSGIQATGDRYLVEGEEVSFDAEDGNDGRTRAGNITQPNGEPLVRNSRPRY